MGGIVGDMAMVKTSVTLPREDLEEAQRRGVNVSAVVRAALREYLDDLVDEDQVAAYQAAFAESAEADALWDRTVGDGIDPDDFYDRHENQ